MIRTIGLDIGSQKTIIVADDGEIVRTSTGSVSFPTLISFQDKSPRTIGEEAVSGDTIIKMINLLAGKTLDEIRNCDALTLLKISFSDSLETKTEINTPSIPLINVKYGDSEESLSTTSLLGFYICKVWERITQVYGTDVNLSIACPIGSPKEVVKAYFDACAIAGLELSKISVVDSSDAIIAAYSRKLSAIRGAERVSLDNKLVALVEVGHIQSTVVIVKVEPIANVTNTSLGVTKLSVAHDNNLGCLHFDFKLFDHLAKICASKHATKIEYGTKRGNRLLSGCERLRKLLSQLSEGSITVENLTDNGDVPFSLKRDEFMDISSNLLSRIKGLVSKAMEDAIQTISSLSSETETTIVMEDDKKVGYIEIFGGGLRMPAVQNILTDIFGQDAVIGAKLDDGSIAIGAALVTNRQSDAIQAAITAAINTPMDSISTDTNGTATSTPTTTILTPTPSATVYKVDDVINVFGLSADSIVLARTKELELQTRDAEMRQLLAIRNSMESYILEMRAAPKRKFGELIDEKRLYSLLDESEGWIWDNQDASLQQITDKDTSLRTSVQEICKNYLEAVETDRLDIERKLEEEATKAAAEKQDDDEEDHDNRKLKKADRMRLVVKNKDEGTELFKGGNYRPAAARYHKALSHASKFFDLSPEDELEVKNLKVSLYLNLASCYLKMENKLDIVFTNVEEAIALDPKNPKSYFRRAQYYEAKKDWEKALEDAKKCQNLMDMDDKLVRQTVDRLTKEVAKQKEKEKKMWSKAFA